MSVARDCGQVSTGRTLAVLTDDRRDCKEWVRVWPLPFIRSTIQFAGSHAVGTARHVLQTPKGMRALYHFRFISERWPVSSLAYAGALLGFTREGCRSGS